MATRHSPEFEDRRARWAAEQRPVGESGEWALDRAVAATFRIEACEHALDELTATVSKRAALGWDQDKAIEAATIFGRLGKDPVLASRQLQTSLAGVVLLIQAWLSLAGALGENTDWSESEASRALDLLGIPADLRSGRTPIDAPEGSESVEFRRELAFDEVERLEALHDESMIPLDDMERRQAMKGHIALLSKPAKLILRYGREAWSRYNQAMKELREAREVAPAPPPIIVPPPLPIAPVSQVPRSAEATPRPVKPSKSEIARPIITIGFDDESARLDVPGATHRNEPNFAGSPPLVPCG